MMPSDCFRVLGLSATASRLDIKRAYRRLALELHPDRNRGDDATRRRFVEVSAAYRTLMRAVRGRERNCQIGICRQCGQFVEVFRTIEGYVYCERCILRPQGTRFLPLPRIVIVKCVGGIVLNAVAAACLLRAWWTADATWAFVSLIAGTLGLIVLAATAIRIRHCADPAETAMHKRLFARQTKAEG